MEATNTNAGREWFDNNAERLGRVAVAVSTVAAASRVMHAADTSDVCDYGAKKAPETFTVWVSTLALYNNGFLVGYWRDAIDAPETVEDFLEGLPDKGASLPAHVFPAVDAELWCFDTENAPVRGEMSPSAARAIAEAIEGADIDGDEYPAFLAVAQDQHAETVADIERLAAEWCDTFAGYQTAEDYAAELVDGMGDALPEWCAPYFDMEAFARDLQLGGDITELQTAEGVTFVIRNY